MAYFFRENIFNDFTIFNFESKKKITIFEDCLLIFKIGNNLETNPIIFEKLVKKR